jgi:arylsulfatase A-like enzyme
MEAAGVAVPSGVKGRSFFPLLSSAEARQSWPNQQLIQISESMTGRAIRTKQWTYCVADPTGITTEAASTNYHEYQMYDQGADPYELVNLAGRKEYKEIASTLRDQLKKVMVQAGEADPEIVPAKLYP